MFVVFRADANATIGTGHVMRCLALADALQARGARCLFICAEGLGALADRLRSAGHDLALLPATDRQQADAEASLATLAKQPTPDWIVVDHYGLDAAWQSAIRPFTKKILVIDDLANRRHDCDLLLDQNLRPEAEASPYRALTPASCQYLLGPRHALLRPEFAAARAHGPRNAAAKPRLIVMFGGADQADLTGRTVRLLTQLGLDLPVDVVTGPLYAHREALARDIAELPNATLHCTPGNIAQLMRHADLAIASPGTSSWERCCVALPSITLAVADNQMAMATTLACLGAHLFLGDADRVGDGDLAAAIRLIAGNAPWRESMARAASTVTDGRGAERLAARLIAADVGVRPASAADARLLHTWRNDPRTRQQSFDSSPIPWEGHQAWFAKALANPLQAILIGQLGEVPFGCVRFDLGAHDGRVSIYLDPARHGAGLATPLLEAAGDWLKQNHPAIRRLVAEVKSTNAPSRQAFLKAGYTEDHCVLIKQG